MSIINGERPLGDLKSAHKTKASFNKAMRMDSRFRLEKSGRVKKCAICGTVDGLDVHHILPISSFGDFVRIKTINDAGNLQYLCKAHHAEVHYGNTAYGVT